jgi:excisionase family DNA binding protein
MSERVLELVDDGLETVTGAARFLGISRSLLYRLMDEGRLPFTKINSARRIPRRGLKELAAKGLVLAI